MMGKRSLAVVRPFRPNLSEVAIYRKLLDEFCVTFFFTGLEYSDCRHQLDSLGLESVEAVRYCGYTDLISTQLLQRALDFKVGFGSAMLTKLSQVLEHDVINVVDPLYFHTAQIKHRLKRGQQFDIVRWENLPDRYDKVWRASRDWQRILARADHIICVSEASLYSLPLPLRAKARRIYPGIDVALCERGNAGSRLKVLFVGREQWAKGAEFAYRAVELLRERSIDAELIVLGSACRHFSSCPDWVSPRGTLAIREVRSLMAECDIFCFPSLVTRTWAEQFGFAMVEAMAQALPVVAFDSGCIREICGPDGRYASVGNIYSLATELQELAGADRPKIGIRLRERCQQMFDADVQGEELLRFIS